MRLSQRKMIEAVASLLILIPSILLLAWESRIEGAAFFWLALAFGAGVFLHAMYSSSKRAQDFSLKKFALANGGYLVMFAFLVFEVVSHLIYYR